MYSFARRFVIQVLLLLSLVALIAGLLFSLHRLKRSDYNVLANHMAGKSRQRLKVMKPCPLCGTLLQPEERVHTVVYSGPPPGNRRQDRERPRDSVVHMFGCPYCHPPSSEHTRRCPVCQQVIPPDGFVVARMFEKPGERKHVHVLGCTVCKPNTPRTDS